MIWLRMVLLSHCCCEDYRLDDIDVLAWCMTLHFDLLQGPSASLTGVWVRLVGSVVTRPFCEWNRLITSVVHNFFNFSMLAAGLRWFLVGRLCCTVIREFPGCISHETLPPVLGLMYAWALGKAMWCCRMWHGMLQQQGQHSAFPLSRSCISMVLLCCFRFKSRVISRVHGWTARGLFGHWLGADQGQWSMVQKC